MGWTGWTLLFWRMPCVAIAGAHSAIALLWFLFSFVSGVDVFICGSDGSVKYVPKKRHYCVHSEHYIPAQIEASNSALKSNASLQHSGQA